MPTDELLKRTQELHTRRSGPGGQQLVISAAHYDFPALIAEALDQLQAHRLDMPRAAEVLGVTATQLAKLFRKDAAAWTVLNRLRVNQGLAALK